MNTSQLASSAKVGGALSQKFSATTTNVARALGVHLGSAQAHLVKIVLIAACLTSSAHVAIASAVSLAWNANPETDITGYRLGYGTVSGVYPNTMAVGTDPTASVPGLTEGTTYYFVVSAVNQGGLQSLPSSELSYQVPISAPVNQAPVASSMAVSTAKDTPLGIVLGGSDAEGAALSFSIVSGPANGTLSGTAPNLNYSPSANFNGSDSFTFLVNDGGLNSNVATVNISVNALVPGTLVNGSFESNYAGWAVTGSAFIESVASSYIATDGVKLASLNGDSTSDSVPNAVLSQAFATTAGTNYTLAFDMGVIGSASGEQKLQVTVDGAGNVLTQIASKTKTAGGSAQWSAMSYTFVANSAITTLTFRDISAVTAGIDTLLDNVRVAGSPTSVNTAPVAVADSYSTATGTALVVPAAGVLANDTDAQSNPLTAAVVAGPSQGSLTLNTNGGFTYTPAVGYSGTDSFAYRANDGNLNSASATVSITVVQVNSAPVATSKSVTTAEDTSLAIVLGGSDNEGSTLSFSIVSGPSKGTLSGTAPNLSYSPSANSSGSDSFTFRVNDGTVNSAPATISITVTPVNDAPLAIAKSVTTAEDTPLPITLGGTDVENNNLTFSIAAAPTQGTLTGTAPNLTYSPSASFNGTDQFTFRVNDGTVNSAPATVSITVTSVNDAPVAVAKSVSVEENGSLPITLTGTDLEGSLLSFIVLSGPANGLLSGTAPNLTYYPGVGFNGSDAITFRVNDGLANSAPATISITVTPVNDVPNAVSNSVTTAEDSPLPITLGGTDAEGNPLTFTIVGDPANGTLSGTAPNLTYQPTTNFNGNDAFSFRVNDGQADSLLATVLITVTPVNDAPLAVAKSVTAVAGSPLSITLGGTDPDADSLTFTVVAAPTHGTLTGSAPNLTYSPEANFTGADQFSFLVNDGSVNSVPATVSITVNPPNSVPVFAADPINLAATESQSFAGQLLATDADAGDVLAFQKVSGPAWLTVSSAGELGGTPLESDVGTGSFSVSVSDPSNASATATLIITVANNTANDNTPPDFAVNPLVYPAGTEKELYLGQSLASTATDSDAGDTITYSKVGGPAWLVVAQSGALSGTPPSGSAGTNLFTVRATDKAGASDETTLQIKINANTLPLPWNLDLVGSGNIAGAATYSAPVFTIAGAGLIASTEDSGSLGWQTLSGDCSITARVSSLSDTGTSARVGVMIRASLAANSRQLFMGVDGSGKYQWIRRLSTGGSTSRNTKSAVASAAIWVRLVRAGNVVTAFQSANGTTWNKIGSATVTLPSNCYVGLWVASGNKALLNSSRFNNVTVTP